MGQILTIQMLRAFAALAVAYGHAGWDAIQIAARAGQGATMPLRELSAAGVDLFFVISGFVMVWSSRDQFGQPGAPRRFLHRRIARIVPLYWLMTTAMVVMLAILPAAANSAFPTLAELVKSYLFIPYRRLADGSVQPVFGLGWTLNYEMFFYLVFAPLLFLRAGAAVAILTGLFGLLAAVHVLAQPTGVELWFWTSPIILEFVLGALVAFAFLKGFRLLPVPAMLTGFVAVVWFAVANDTAMPPTQLGRLVAVGVPAALLFSAVVLADRGAGRQPGGRAIAALGDASYALYLVHPFVIRAFSVVWSKIGLGHVAGGWLFVALALAVSSIVALGLYRFFERPVTRALQPR